MYILTDEDRSWQYAVWRGFLLLARKCAQNPCDEAWVLHDVFLLENYEEVPVKRALCSGPIYVLRFDTLNVYFLYLSLAYQNEWLLLDMSIFIYSYI